MAFVSSSRLADYWVSKGFWYWIFHLGALSFIPLGLLDSSVFPVPGSMDVLMVVLSARQRTQWPLYALVATIGSVAGALITFRLARKGGHEALSKRVKPKTLEKVKQRFERWGFGAIAIPAMLPPPIPLVPFVMAAGAAQYPVKKFVLSLSLGRAVRYGLLGFLAARYGRHILSFFRRFSGAGHVAIAGLFIASAASILFLILWKRHHAAVATHSN